MISYSKLLIILAFLASVIVLIIGVVKPINGMIIGGVIGLLGSALLLMSVMIQSSTKPKETTKKIITVNNPIPEV
jgi:hypothetical protein